MYSQQIPMDSNRKLVEKHSKPMEIPRKSDGNPMEIPWKSHENPMEIPWKSHGKPMENPLDPGHWEWRTQDRLAESRQQDGDQVLIQRFLDKHNIYL